MRGMILNLYIFTCLKTLFSLGATHITITFDLGGLCSVTMAFAGYFCNWAVSSEKVPSSQA